MEMIDRKSLLASLTERLIKANPHELAVPTDAKPIRSTCNGPLFIDPGSVELIISVAGLIVEYLKSKTADTQEISNELAELNQQLQVISRKLDTVITLIKGLYEYIDDRFDEEARRQTFAIIETIGQNYESWRMNPELLKRDGPSVLLRLQDSANRLKQNSMTYYNSVAIAAHYHRSMLHILSSPKAAIIPAMNGYATYFSDCLNPSLAGSLTYRLNKINSELRDLFMIDAGWVRPLVEEADVCQWHCVTESTIGRFCYTWSISGNVSEGYVRYHDRQTIDTGERKSSSLCRDRDHRLNYVITDTRPFPRGVLSQPLPGSGGYTAVSWDGCAAMHERFKQLVANQGLMETAISRVNEYQAAMAQVVQFEQER